MVALPQVSAEKRGANLGHPAEYRVYLCDSILLALTCLFPLQ